jgi:hypothetical protein
MLPETLGRHCQPSSTAHCALHPSPPRRLLSSHCSAPSTLPFPQAAEALPPPRLLLPPERRDDDARLEEPRLDTAPLDDERAEDAADDARVELLPADPLTDDDDPVRLLEEPPLDELIPDELPPELRADDRADETPPLLLPPPVWPTLEQFWVLMIFCHAHSYTWQPSP